MQSLTQSPSQGLGTLLGYIPQLIGAIVIMIVGYIIAKILQAIVTRVLRAWASSAGWSRAA